MRTCAASIDAARRGRWAAVALAAAALTFPGTRGARGAGRSRDAGADDGILTLRDPRLWREPITRYWEVYFPRNGALAMPRADPKYQRSFPYECIVRVWRNPADGKDARFYVHFREPADEALARRVGGILARVYWLGDEYLGMIPPEPAVDVWLLRDGQPGAEELANDIYLYAIAHDRAPAEWLREIAHEYSHLVLPAVGPFTQPERWGNGYLGERLFLQWLIRAGQTDAWGQPFSGAAYLANQVIPLRDRYLNAGPASLTPARGDAGTMDRFIGFALSIEASYGPRVLRDGLRRATSTLPAAIATGWAEAIRAAGQPLEQDPRVCIPAQSDTVSGVGEGLRARTASYWAFLPSGDWTLELDGDGLAGAGVRLDDAPCRLLPGSNATRLRYWAHVTGAAWRRLRVSTGAGRQFTLARVGWMRTSAG